jgi:hypothetical protein
MSCGRTKEIVATGRMTTETEVEVGDELRLAGLVGRVCDVVWAAGELRLPLKPSHHVTPAH